MARYWWVLFKQEDMTFFSIYDYYNLEYSVPKLLISFTKIYNVNMDNIYYDIEILCFNLKSLTHDTFGIIK